MWLRPRARVPFAGIPLNAALWHGFAVRRSAYQRDALSLSVAIAGVASSPLVRVTTHTFLLRNVTPPLALVLFRLTSFTFAKSAEEGNRSGEAA